MLISTVSSEPFPMLMHNENSTKQRLHFQLAYSMQFMCAHAEREIGAALLYCILK